MRTKDSRFAGRKRAATVLAALVLAAAFGCDREEVVIEPEPPRPVRYVRVSPVGGARVRSFAGWLRANRC